MASASASPFLLRHCADGRAPWSSQSSRIRCRGRWPALETPSATLPAYTSAESACEPCDSGRTALVSRATESRLDSGTTPLPQSDDCRERSRPHCPLGRAVNPACGPIDRLEGHSGATF